MRQANCEMLVELAVQLHCVRLPTRWRCFPSVLVFTGGLRHLHLFMTAGETCQHEDIVLTLFQHQSHMKYETSENTFDPNIFFYD